MKRYISTSYQYIPRQLSVLTDGSGSIRIRWRQPPMAFLSAYERELAWWSESTYVLTYSGARL